jgi:hypothetical protein
MNQELRLCIQKRIELLNVKEDIFRKNWIKYKKCSCVEKLYPKKVLVCTHVKTAMDEAFIKEHKKINELVDLLLKQIKLHSHSEDDQTLLLEDLGWSEYK